MHTATVRVCLSPAPGFCIKSSTLQPAVCKITAQSAQSLSKLDGPSQSALITSTPGTLSLPKGIKVFVNIAWDANVPPPPEGSEETIQRAMKGEDETSFTTDGGWFVPVIVSEPRSDADKAGKPSVAFDCVYNSSLKSRTLRDPSFRAFLVELGIQRIEAQYSLLLSRQLGTPNITSKGKLLPRNVLVPLALYPSEHPLHENTNKTKKPLVEELEPRTKLVEDISNKLKLVEEVETKSKGILKSGPVTTQKKECPKFKWVKEGDKLKITVHVPKLRSTHIPNATLDLESRRIILDAAPFYSLDVDLSLSDAQIMSVSGGASSDNPALTLKRQRDLDVDNATAEWHVGEGVLVILA